MIRIGFISGVSIALFICAANQESRAEGSRIVSWNMQSRQFIDAPAFQLLSIPKTGTYRVTVEQGGKSWKVESSHPWIDLASIWEHVPVKKFKITFQWLDAAGKVLAEEGNWRVKAPDWQGFHEAPEDWAAAADRAVNYLIRVGEQGSAPYREPGMPVWMWSAASPTPQPTRESSGPGFDHHWLRDEFQRRHD
ncbi:MAG: hypothetical protein IT426_20285 [Pirellulales bacterium]|nr:hypothetical protein [Pirellulales bacterium]